MWIRAEACRVEVLISIKRVHFALLLFSTQMCKLNLVGEVFEEVSLGVHCCCSVFLMCVVKKDSVLLYKEGGFLCCAQCEIQEIQCCT